MKFAMALLTLRHKASHVRNVILEPLRRPLFSLPSSMSLIQVEDGGGASIELVEMDDGIRMANASTAEQVAYMYKGLPDMRCREDDIFVCGPMKCGTHWLWEIISMLFNGKAESIPKSKIDNMIDFSLPDHLEAIPSPRVLNSHIQYDHLPREMKEKRCKIVFPLRNPKDVAVSHFHHISGIIPYKYDGQWKHFLPLFLEGKGSNEIKPCSLSVDYLGWFDYVKEWEELITNNPDLAIHLVYYEDLTGNNLDEIRRLGKFLGIDNKDDLFERISKKCVIEQMKKDQVYSPEHKAVLKGDFSFYRKGVIGDWKNHFTVAQSEYFDKIYNERMKDSKLKFRYENCKSQNV